MGNDERNFRSSYYEKVGFKSAEEKKSLEILLVEKHLDREKLQQFCLEYCVPHIYRNFVWKVLLGVMSRHIDNHKFIMDQRKQQYQDLLKTVQVITSIDNKTPMELVLLGIWSIEIGNFCSDLNKIEKIYPEASSFVAIVKFLLYCFDDETDVYWIARNFYKFIQEIQNEYSKLIDSTYILLEREDPELFKYLIENNILDKLPFNKWFDCCFAGVLNENCIAKIWDKVCAGSYNILAFLVTSLLTNLKHRIMKCKDADSVVKVIEEITKESADIIINESIGMWQNV